MCPHYTKHVNVKRDQNIVTYEKHLLVSQRTQHDIGFDTFQKFSQNNLVHVPRV